MRILFLNTRLARRLRAGEGSSAHFIGIAGHLAKRGHDVLLPCRDFASFRYASGCVRPLNLWALQQLDVTYIRMEGWPIRDLSLFRSGPWRRLLPKRHIFVWEVNAASELALFDGADLSPARLRELDDVLRRQARGIDGAICNTQGLVRFAEDLGIRNRTHIELATFTERFIPSNHGATRTEVCWVAGNVGVGWHDWATVRDAARRLVDKTTIHFHFVGDFPVDDTLPNATFHGRLPQAALSRLLGRMDIGLGIYRSPSWSRYGVFSSPLKIFDYMAAGLHVIASPIEQAAILERNGASIDIVPFEDSAALTAKIAGWAKDAANLQRCRSNVDLATTQYDWKRAALQTEETLSRWLSGRAGTREP